MVDIAIAARARPAFQKWMFVAIIWFGFFLYVGTRWIGSSGSWIDLMGALMISGAATAFGLGFFWADRLARAVTLSASCVRGSKMVKNGFGLPLAAHSFEIPWANVTKVGFAGTTIYVYDGTSQLAINCLLFDEPKKVSEFVRAQLSASGNIPDGLDA
jgi:hypothetical protein